MCDIIADSSSYFFKQFHLVAKNVINIWGG